MCEPPPVLSAVRRILASGPVPDSYPLRDGETAAAWRAQALADLDALATAGRLAAPDARGGTLADHLAALASGPLAPGLEPTPGRTLLLGELVRNVAAPGRINQGLKFTCAATCVEIELAERDPGEYARLVAGLAAPAGVVALRSGEPLPRDEDTLAWDAAEARRSPVSRLVQVAFLEFAYPGLDYRNAADRQFEPAPPPAESADGGAGGAGGAPGAETDRGFGVDLDAFDRLLEAVTGERWDTLSERQSRLARLFAQMGLATDGLPDLGRDALTLIERTTAAGETLFGTLQLTAVDNPFAAGGPAWHEGLAHKVRILGLAPDPAGGTRVLYDDPVDPARAWYVGLDSRIEDPFGRCSLPVEDLRAALTELSYRPKFWALAHPVPAPGEG